MIETSLAPITTAALVKTNIQQQQPQQQQQQRTRHSVTQGNQPSSSGLQRNRPGYSSVYRSNELKNRVCDTQHSKNCCSL
jgi:hypothetical protein